MSFKLGDRVRYYGAYNNEIEVGKATILDISSDGLLRISTDGPSHDAPTGWIGFVHPRQCRKLKKKQELYAVLTEPANKRMWIVATEACETAEGARALADRCYSDQKYTIVKLVPVKEPNAGS